jgi:hypothetical protein
MTEGKAARSTGSEHKIARRFVARRFTLACSYWSKSGDFRLPQPNNKTSPIV